MTDQNGIFPVRYFVSTVLGSLETKTALSSGAHPIYLMRAAMAGGLAGIMYLADFAVVAGFAGIVNGECASGARGSG